MLAAYAWQVTDHPGSIRRHWLCSLRGRGRTSREPCIRSHESMSFRPQAIEAMSQLAAITAEASGNAEHSLTTAASVAKLERTVKQLSSEVVALHKSRAADALGREDTESLVAQAVATASGATGLSTVLHHTDSEVSVHDFLQAPSGATPFAVLLAPSPAVSGLVSGQTPWVNLVVALCPAVTPSRLERLQGQRHRSCCLFFHVLCPIQVDQSVATIL